MSIFSGEDHTYYWVNKKQHPELRNVQGLLEKLGDSIFGIKSLVAKSALNGDALALALSSFSETGQWGLEGPGVQSYADIVSNWEGYRFWTNLTSGDHPLVKCEGERWIVMRDFDWSEYINPAWDEAINCSVPKPEIAKLITTPACPVDSKACHALAKLYGPHAAQLLHPKCLEAAKRNSSQ